jgi:LacI family transcriptional regulator
VAPTPVAGADWVTADNDAAATMLGEHLVANGARAITFVGDPEASSDVAQRFDALVRAARRGGATVTLSLVPDFGEAAGAQAALDALSARRRGSGRLPDAFACANDELALGLLMRLREAGVRVPEDTLVSGWDDVMAARYAGLTTVRQPMRELGVRAAQLLDQLVNDSRGHSEPVHEVLATELIVRQTTQPSVNQPFINQTPTLQTQRRPTQGGTTPPPGGNPR